MDIPAWHTDTVLAIIRGIRKSQDFSALPILADALQDADYPDEEVLAQMRSGKFNLNALDLNTRKRIPVDRLLCSILGGEYQAAVENIEKMAKKYKVTYDEMMSTAIEAPSWPEIYDIDSSDMFIGESGDKEVFWNNYSVITGEDNRGGFDIFECGC